MIQKNEISWKIEPKKQVIYTFNQFKHIGFKITKPNITKM